MLSIIYLLLLPRHSLPSLSVHVTSLSSFSKLAHPTFHPTCQQNCSISVRFVQFPSHFVIQIPLVISTPFALFCPQLFPLLHFANAVVKLFFPRRFFLCLSNHTNQIAASITHFHLNHHSFLQLRQPSAHFYSHSPHHLFTLIFLIFCNIS